MVPTAMYWVCVISCPHNFRLSCFKLDISDARVWHALCTFITRYARENQIVEGQREREPSVCERDKMSERTRLRKENQDGKLYSFQTDNDFKRLDINESRQVTQVTSSQIGKGHI